MYKLPSVLICSVLLVTPPALSGTEINQRTLSTNGYGEVNVQPDMARLHLHVTVAKKKALDAKQEVDNRVNRLLADLATNGIDDKDIIASNLQTSPRYEHSSISGRKFVGYQASRRIEITIRQLDKLTDIMDVALANDIQTINQIAYESSAADKYRKQARLNAIADSKNKASFLAQAYNAELGSISTISYHSRHQINPGVTENMMMADAALKSAAPNRGVYKAREITFSDNIQVVFDLIISD